MQQYSVKLMNEKADCYVNNFSSWSYDKTDEECYKRSLSVECTDLSS